MSDQAPSGMREVWCFRSWILRARGINYPLTYLITMKPESSSLDLGRRSFLR